MKRVALADLMEAGIENTEPITGTEGTTDVVETQTACAIGAAQFPVLTGMTTATSSQLEKMLNNTDIDEGTFESGDGYSVSLHGSLYGCLWRINDLTGVSREAVCQWVRSIEDKYDLYIEVEEETPEPALPIPA